MTVEDDPNEECNRTITVVGQGGKIPAKSAEMYIENTATAARFLSALVSLGHGEYKIVGNPRMNQRPMGVLFDALRSQGVQVECTGNKLPAVIKANGLKGGDVSLGVNDSSQFVSALILISRHANLNVQLDGSDDKEHGYIEMTQRMLREFTPDYLIEPDLSGASYFVAAGFLTGGHVHVAGWPQIVTNGCSISRIFASAVQSISSS